LFLHKRRDHNDQNNIITIEKKKKGIKSELKKIKIKQFSYFFFFFFNKHELKEPGLN